MNHNWPVRYRIVGLLALFSLVAYVLRMNISVAAKLMAPDLGLSQIEMGRVFSAFMIGYAMFQVPWGQAGDRAGPRITLTIAGSVWVITTALTGLLPGRVGGAAMGSLGILLVLRFLLGAAQAAIFPVAARAVGNWMPAMQRAFGYSWIIAAGMAGSAFTGPGIAWSMVTLGWRTSFYAGALLAAIVVVLWHWYARDTPQEHPQVDRSELIEIGQAAVTPPPFSWTSLARLTRDRNVVFMCASYFLSSYLLFVFVFWSYLYLVDERKFSVLSGGFFNALPFACALVVVPATGWLSDRLSRRLGSSLTGRRIVAMSCFVVSAAALWIATQSRDAYAAIGGLCISVAFLVATEGPFWSSAIDIGRGQSGTVGGIMNMSGNLGGVVSTALVPVLVERFGWPIALGSGSALAVVAALIWLLIRPAVNSSTRA